MDVSESREETVMSRRNFGEDGTIIRRNLSRAFGMRTSSGNCPKRSASSRAPARRTPTRPLAATKALYAGVLLAEIRDAWAASHLVRLLATDDFQTHRAATGAQIPLRQLGDLCSARQGSLQTRLRSRAPAHREMRTGDPGALQSRVRALLLGVRRSDRLARIAPPPPRQARSTARSPYSSST